MKPEYKPIPIWTQEPLSLSCDQDAEMVYCNCQEVWIRNKTHLDFFSEGQQRKIDVVGQHVVPKSLSEFYLLSVGGNRRYRVHLYNRNGTLRELTTQGCSPMLKHHSKAFADE